MRPRLDKASVDAPVYNPCTCIVGRLCGKLYHGISMRAGVPGSPHFCRMRSLRPCDCRPHARRPADARRPLWGSQSGAYSASPPHFRYITKADQVIASPVQEWCFTAEEDARQGDFGATVHVVAHSELNGEEHAVSVTLPKGESDIFYGDSFSATCALSQPREASAERFYFQGTDAVSSPGAIERLDNSRSLGGVLANVRKSAIALFDGQGDTDTLCQALVCGYREQLRDSDLYAACKTVGVAHLVAVSGAHLFHHVRDDRVRSSGRSNAKEALPCDTACCDFNLSVTDGDAHIRTSSCGDGYRRHDVVPRTPTSDNTLSAWRVHCRDHYLPRNRAYRYRFFLSAMSTLHHRAHAAHLIVAVSRPHRAADRRAP